LFRALAELTRELVTSRRSRDSAPAPEGTFRSRVCDSRFGNKQKQMQGLRSWCDRQPDFADIAELCSGPPATSPAGGRHRLEDGYVYCFTHPRAVYKIGLTRSLPRRWADIQQGDPEEVELVHYFKTVDPEESRRTGSSGLTPQRRDRGEWFALSRAQVAEFKRRAKSM